MNHLLLQIILKCGLFIGLSSRNVGLFTINTKGCVIRALHPFDDSIMHLIDTPYLTCETLQPPLLDNNDTHIWVIKENVNVFDETKFSCCYKHFKDKESFESFDCINFDDIIVIQEDHEFVHVECFYMDNSLDSNFYAFVPLKRIHSTKSRFNILVLGLESISRMNFYRTMPNTLKFFKERGAIELKGYNKLGDNSIPNLIPLLVGQPSAKVENTCIEDRVWDEEKCPIIWNNYKSAGYLTALAADSNAGLFEPYFDFKVVPTDYYLHPFISQSTKIIGRNKRVNYHLCMGDKFYHNVLLDYIFQLTSKLRYNNLFGFFWEESVSHDGLNYPKIMDDNYERFFKRLQDSGYLNETIVILLSDHGFRWGEIVRTYQGHMEERLPIASFLLPDIFRKKHKKYFNNLKNNAQKLTTAFDIYATLKHLINIDKEKVKKEHISKAMGISLFREIPSNRTCASVGIDDHWCTCYRGQVMLVFGQTAIEAGDQLLLHINKLLKAYRQCEELTVAEVIRASIVDDSNNDEKCYNVIVKASPGSGVFEGTLWKKGSQWAVSGSVSRLDQYGFQKTCIEDYYHKMYCYCK